MKIILDNDSNLHKDLEDFFNRNQIKFEKKSFWNSAEDMSIIPDNYILRKDVLYIINYQQLRNFLETDLGRASLVKFTEHNQLLVQQQGDTGMKFTQLAFHDMLCELNLDNIKFVVAEKLLINTPKNLQLAKKTFNMHFAWVPELIPPTVDKKSNAKDFFVTTVLRDRRQHRQILYEKLRKNKVLYENSTIVFHKSPQDWKKNHLGDKDTILVDHQGFHASHDLYSNHYFELVPETMHQHVHHYSEKTAKPIITCTPFIIAGTPLYLEYLREVGYKTFADIFDETYDTVIDLEDRIESIVETLKYIKNTGFEKLYHKSKHVLEHNFYHIQHLKGRYLFESDRFWYELCKEYGIQ